MSQPWAFTPPGHPGIEIRLGKCGGQPCHAGTRLPADIVPAMLAQGYGHATIYEWYPSMTLGMINAAIAWDADPDRKRITRNALRRQRYARAKEEQP